MGLVLHKLTCTCRLSLIIYNLGSIKIYPHQLSIYYRFCHNRHPIRCCPETLLAGSCTKIRTASASQVTGLPINYNSEGDGFGGDVTPQSHTTLVSDGPSDQKRSCHQWRKGTQLLINQGFLSFPFFFFQHTSRNNHGPTQL